MTYRKTVIAGHETNGTLFKKGIVELAPDMS